MTEEQPAEDLSAGKLPASLALQRAGPLNGTVAAPGSKSHTNRALVAAALATGESRLVGPLIADDTDRMVAGLRALGVQITRDGDDYVVTGTGGELGPPDGTDVVIDAGGSGTTLRFLIALATLARSVVTITGSESLQARPIGPLVDALSQLGCNVEAPGGHAPVTVRPGPPSAGRVEVDASTSSQYVSALALVGPYATGTEAGGRVELVPVGLGAAGYVELTAELMRRWGAAVETGDGVITVQAGRHYQARTEQIAGDASAAAHLFALAVASGGEVSVTNLSLATSQPDMGILDVLSSLGVGWRWEGDDTVVVAGPEVLVPIEVDLSAMPDLLPTVAVLAALAFGRSVLTGLEVSKYHETDRITAVAAELARLGISSEAGENTLIINGGGPQGMVTISTYGDHRMAMAFTALGARLPFIVIQDPACVAKTYPGFWSAARSMGLGWKSRLNFAGLKF